MQAACSGAPPTKEPIYNLANPTLLTMATDNDNESNSRSNRPPLCANPMYAWPRIGSVHIVVERLRSNVVCGQLYGLTQPMLTF
ncbi:hypothetical protein GQX74_012091 [Glossina fuscipes]|nr:hypothetical protein GQX74_012091 [Glossina fuscipes]